jgi:hypothetical protein
LVDEGGEVGAADSEANGHDIDTIGSRPLVAVEVVIDQTHTAGVGQTGHGSEHHPQDNQLHVVLHEASSHARGIPDYGEGEQQVLPIALVHVVRTHEHGDLGDHHEDRARKEAIVGITKS